MDKTMIVGSPAHHEHMRNEAETHIELAMEKVADQGVFSDDQTNALQAAIWEVFRAITKTI